MAEIRIEPRNQIGRNAGCIFTPDFNLATIYQFAIIVRASLRINK
jgi:hypothetical protein